MDRQLVKGYYVQIPPTLCEVLEDIGGTTGDDDFDAVVNAAVRSFFSFYSPSKISSSLAEQLEKYVLHYYIMRRVGSGNIRKFKQIFRNRWNTIMPYYERILETIEKESEYFKNPILTQDTSGSVDSTGTMNSQTDSTRDTDTTFDTSRTVDHTGESTHTTDDTTGRNTTGSNSNTEVNRYSDTPQGDSGAIWEVGAGGTPVLTNRYLTDIRGITNNGSANTNETGTLDRDEAGTDKYQDKTVGKDTTGYGEVGKVLVDQDTTSKQTHADKGYSGTSPVDLMLKYRESFTRTFEDIANELSECFYNLVEVDDLINF